MKKLIMYIIKFWNWFISLFQKRQQPEVKAKIEPKPEEEGTPFHENKILRHSNRKNTKGRHTQYISIGNGRYKPIYHTV